jgi:hypothetical protein
MIHLPGQKWLCPLTQFVLCCCVFGPPFSALAADSETGPKGLYVRNGVLMREGRPYLGVGANYQTLFGKLLQNKDDTSSLDKLARLGKAGIPFVRFRASGFSAENQKLYLQDRPEFFRRMDLVVRCAEQNRIGLIPSLFWRLATVSELVGEDRNQLGNPDSKANQFIRQFTQEMVTRYNDSSAIWGWEFGNEANLAIDLPGGGARRNPRALFGGDSQPGEARLTSEQLRTVYTLFAQTVRKTDPWRIIEPGTAMPRTSAWHLARGTGWGHDSPEQSLSTLLTLAPDPMNMISAHVYAKAKELYPARANSTEGVLALLMKQAAAAGKPLFLGEFPVRDQAQAQEFLRAIEVNRVPLSAFWVFDYQAQERTMSVDFDNERSFALDLVVKANRVLQGQ